MHGFLKSDAVLYGITFYFFHLHWLKQILTEEQGSPLFKSISLPMQPPIMSAIFASAATAHICLAVATTDRTSAGPHFYTRFLFNFFLSGVLCAFPQIVFALCWRSSS
jgi:hypothetical protein